MLSIIMPAYNEAEYILKSIQRTVEVLEKHRVQYELILVDDGSKDGTLENASTASINNKHITAIGYQPNRGKGYALKYGAHFAKGDLVLFLDSDMDLPPAQIPIFLKYMEKESVDVVIGSKRHPLSKLDYPLSRRFLSNGYSLLLRLMFNLKVTETQTGIKLFRKKVLDQVLPNVFVERFAFDLELLAQINKAKFNIIEAPVQIDFHFRSNVDVRQIWKMFTDTLGIYYRINFSRRPGSHVKEVKVIATEEND